MPALKFLGRTWRVASDDFVFPSFVEMILQFLWVASLASAYLLKRTDFACDTSHTLERFFFGIIGLEAADLIMTVAVLAVSMQGTIHRGWPRRNIGWCLMLKLLIYIGAVVWVALSTYWMFTYSYHDCGHAVTWTARGVLLWAWGMRLLKLVSAVIMFHPWADMPPPTKSPTDLNQAASNLTNYGSAAVSLWQGRFRRVCGCLMSGPASRQAYRDVGRIAANYFNVDLVSSDILAGFMLLLKQQMMNEMGVHDPCIVNPVCDRFAQAGPSSESSGSPSPPDWMSIANLAYYIRYAIAAYGSLTYVTVYPCSGPCKVYRERDPETLHGQTYGDDKYQSNTEAIKRWLKIKNEDLIYVSHLNEYKVQPFYVAVDRSKNVVVVALRGSNSADDAMADFDGCGAKLPIEGVEKAFCHQNMLERATYVLEMLNSKKLLDKAFAKLDNMEAMLVVTGHSLGSGVASVLSVLLKPEFPHLKCYAFSPMGCTMSESASKYTEDFICSVTLNSDIIIRLDMFTLTRLKINMLNLLIHSKNPKYQILASGCMRFLYCCCLGGRATAQSEDTRALIPSPQPRYSDETNGKESYLEVSLREAVHHLEKLNAEHWPVRPPGTLLHIVEDDRSGCCSSKKFQAYWKSSSSFQKVVLTSSMLNDHMPWNVMAALDSLLENQAKPITVRGS